MTQKEWDELKEWVTDKIEFTRFSVHSNPKLVELDERRHETFKSVLGKMISMESINEQPNNN